MGDADLWRASRVDEAPLSHLRPGDGWCQSPDRGSKAGQGSQHSGGHTRQATGSFAEYERLSLQKSAVSHHRRSRQDSRCGIRGGNEENCQTFAKKEADHAVQCNVYEKNRRLGENGTKKGTNLRWVGG